MGTTNLDTLVLSGSLTANGVNDTGIGAGSVKTGITAHAGGGQASATPLPSKVNSVDTVATAADSVALPLAVAGQSVFVTNSTATSMQVFGAGTDTINIGAGDVATGTGVAQAGNKTALYICTVSAPAGKWQRIVTA